MSVQITLHDNDLKKTLSSELLKQYPYAVSKSLNRVAIHAQNDLRQHEATDLTTTNKWLERNTRVDFAKKQNLQAEVGLLDRVYFAERLVQGGDKTPTTTEYLWVPVGVPTNARGAIRKSLKPKALINNPKYFIKEINGTMGAWKKDKRNNSISLAYVLKQVNHYNDAPYLDVENIIENSAKQHNFEEIMQQELLKALR